MEILYSILDRYAVGDRIQLAFWRFSGHEPLCLLFWPCTKPFSAPNSSISVWPHCASSTKLITCVINNTGLTTMQISPENSQPYLALSGPYLSGAPAQLEEDCYISLYWGFKPKSPAHCRAGPLMLCSTHCVLVTVAVSSFWIDL